VEPAAAQCLDHREPAAIEVRSRRRRSAARNAVGLLDERHSEIRRERHIPRLDNVLCRDSTARPMPEHEDASWVIDLVAMGVRRAIGSVEDEHRHSS
jgi:hypothetical protein